MMWLARILLLIRQRTYIPSKQIKKYGTDARSRYSAFILYNILYVLLQAEQRVDRSLNIPFIAL